MMMRIQFFARLSLATLAIPPLGAWGVRGHTVANLAAVEGIPDDGPTFLKAQNHSGYLARLWRALSSDF